MLNAILSLVPTPSGGLFLTIVISNLALIAVCVWLLWALRGSTKRNERWEDVATEALERERMALESSGLWRNGNGGC